MLYSLTLEHIVFQRASPDIHRDTPPLTGMAPSPSSAEGDLTARQPPPAHTDRSNIPFAIGKCLSLGHHPSMQFLTSCSATHIQSSDTNVTQAM